MTSNLAVGSTFILGALHALQPGHTNSFLAAYTVGQKLKIKEILSLGLSLLISHFLMLTILAVVLTFVLDGVVKDELFHVLEWLAPLVVIGFGVFLLVRYFRQRNKEIECACGQHHSASHPHFQQPSPASLSDSEAVARFKVVQGVEGKTLGPVAASTNIKPLAPTGMAATTKKNQNPIIAGIISGILPCPTVVAPLMLAGVSGSFGNMLLYLLIYVVGMGLVLTSLVAGIYFTKDFIVKQLGAVSKKFDTRWVAAALVILVGVVYLGFNMVGHAGHVH